MYTAKHYHLYHANPLIYPDSNAPSVKTHYIEFYGLLYSTYYQKKKRGPKTDPNQM